ncbi:transglycosylase SLT domain-containing protein [Microvirga sp. W0021]|uniref:Transglycosylase SLT domain-containing protein n=1 Tax=Hohaiivirga grylli TaxID=3133970 RepID=A0ABV0BIX3_9HYPH
MAWQKKSYLGVAALIALGGVSIYALISKTGSFPGFNQEKEIPVVESPQERPTSQPETPRVSPPPQAIPSLDQDIPLPRPLSDADTLQFLNQAYEVGTFESPEITFARNLLQTPIGRTLDQWLVLRKRPAPLYQNFVDFRNAFPDWPLSPLMKRREEIALLTSKLPETLKQDYFRGNDPDTSTGKIYWASILLNEGHKDKAADLIRPIWRKELLLPTTEQRLRTAYTDLLTKEDHRARLTYLLERKKWDAALRSANDNGTPFEAIVKIRIAAEQNAKTAQTQIDAYLKDNKADPLVLYSQLLLYRKQGKYDLAGSIFEKLSTLGTGVQLSETECRDWQGQQRFIIRELMDEKDFKKAFQTASAKISKLGCNHNDADFLAGWIALRFLNNPIEAKQHFDRLATNASSSSQKARAAYWLGRLAAHNKETPVALAAYEKAANYWNTYYGQLASDKLNDGLLHLPSKSQSSQETLALFEKNPAIQAIRLFSETRNTEVATQLFIDQAAILPDLASVEALAELAEETKNTQAALAIAKIAARRGLSLETRSYPDFGLPVRSDSPKSVEQALVYAIAHQESAFNVSAKSRAGALGLMQLMPGTAKLTAAGLKKDYEPERLLSDPAYNIEIGAAHLRDLLTAWDGSIILTFAAYNAGSGNVKKWLTAHGDPRLQDVDEVDWIERIPFYETRHYVQRISENLMIYRKLFGQKPGQSGKNSQ